MKTLRIYSLNNFPIYHKIVLAIVIMLYFTALVLTYLYIWKFGPCNHLLPIPLPHPPPLATTSLISFSTKFFFFFNSTHKWNHIVFVFLCLTSLCIMASRSIYTVPNGRFFLYFYDWIIFHYLYGVGNDNLLQYSCLEKSHGQRSLVGYSPWSFKESDMTK